jgi:ribonucleoside-diphosphate reductase beta chain
MPEEVPLGEDCRDWAQKLTDHERNLLTQIFRFFTQADVEVQDCYHEKYGRIFKPTEIKMMLAAFSNMETVHIAAYSHLLDTIGMPESEYGMFLQYKEMKDKHDYLATFGVDTDEDIAKTLAMFGGFTEGLQLFASFAMLMNFPRFNKMKGMGQIVSWSVRDESLHCEGIIKLFHAFLQGARLPHPRGQEGDPRHLPPHGGAGGRVHRSGVRDGPGLRHDRQGDQAVYPLHRRLAPRPARPEADVHDRRTPPPLARPAAQRRRTRQLLRNPRHRIFQGRDPRQLERGLGQFRQRKGAKAANDVPAAEGDEDMFARAGVAAE